jgi:hypothetical protein
VDDSLSACSRPRRWLGVGHSSDPDARRAAEEALQQGAAKLVVVFCSDAHDLEALLGAVNHSLNDQPALDVYLQRLGALDDAYRDPEAFTRFALTHPLGMSRRSGEDQVRFIDEADLRSAHSAASPGSGRERSFDCIARRGVLGNEGVRTEVERVARHAAGAPVAGLHTYREIARTKGVSGSTTRRSCCWR